MIDRVVVTTIKTWGGLIVVETIVMIGEEMVIATTTTAEIIADVEIIDVETTLIFRMMIENQNQESNTDQSHQNL